MIEQPWLLAVAYILALEGLGLIILGKRINVFWMSLHGFCQMATGIVGIFIQLQNRWDDYGLLWLAILLVVLSGKWFLHKSLAKNRRLLRNVTPSPVLFAPEMYGYLVASMLVYYLNLVEACSLPAWGMIAWYICFGTSAVVLGTVGGIGLLAVLPPRPLRYGLRVAALIGVSALAVGCFRFIGG